MEDVIEKPGVALYRCLPKAHVPQNQRNYSGGGSDCGEVKGAEREASAAAFIQHFGEPAGSGSANPDASDRIRHSNLVLMIK